MKEEFLDYIEDIIEAMNDAMSFVEGMNTTIFLTIERLFMPL